MLKRVLAKYSDQGIVTEASNEARELFQKNQFGVLKNNHVILSFFEAMYLLENKKLTILNAKKELTEDALLQKIRKKVTDFQTKYVVFRDLREKGYIVKTALKFGADFRVYDKGIAPGQDHSKWIVFPVHESEKLTWHGFSAKNRVAHSTKKHLLIAIVDDEEDVTYYDVNWTRP
ncbi:MAG TPA: tRNA-intron lyase [Candidatus Nanoarchaeia archaeon]|nr:tRNA-intron lyase [Candidatus Nanoarchaeia archaeon]